MVASLDVVVTDSQGLMDLVRCLEEGEPKVVIQLRRELLDLLNDHGGVAGTRCCFACLQGDVPPVLDLQIEERVSHHVLLEGQISLLSRTHVMNSGWKQRLLLAGLRTMSRANSTWYSPGSRSMYFMACCQFFVVV